MFRIMKNAIFVSIPTSQQMIAVAIFGPGVMTSGNIIKSKLHFFPQKYTKLYLFVAHYIRIRSSTCFVLGVEIIDDAVFVFFFEVEYMERNAPSGRHLGGVCLVSIGSTIRSLAPTAYVGSFYLAFRLRRLADLTD